MQTHNKSNAGLLSLILMVAGCAEWNSHPVVVQQNFGKAVNNMVQNQTLYPEHGLDDRPILTMDGQKAQGSIRAYRDMPNSIKDGKLEDAKNGVNFDVKNVGPGTGN